MTTNSDNIKIAAITVTYHPSLQLLTEQMYKLNDCIWIVVDNGSSVENTIAIKQLLKNRSDSYLIENKNNLGLAEAINKGAAYLDERKLEVDFILLLDQDSVPRPESISCLYAQFISLEHQGIRVGCVGPKLLDTKTGAQHGFHQMHHGIWSRYYPAEDSKDPVPCANINGSGTLMRKHLFSELGGLDSSFFIDHIDTEWSFRILSRGYKLYGIPQAVFEHQMGEDSLRFWLFGWKIWPLRSSLRHYYLFRNNIWLLKRSYIPITWKIWSIMKLIITFWVYAIFDRDRKKQIISMIKGFFDATFRK